jgi:hypothetical protein
MITRVQIEKLGALHAVESTMLSLYLAVPPSTNLTARAGELIAAAEAACGRPLAARDRDWVLEKLSPCVRDCTGRTVAVFACAGSGLFEPSRCRVRCRSAGCSASGRTSGPCC